MTQDTRKDRRVKIVSLNVRYKSATVDEFIENHAHDVSRGGIYIKTSNPFPPGTLLKFEIRLASDQAVITGVGRVVWKRDSAQGAGERPSGMGVKFIKIDDPSRAVIERLTSTRADAGKAFESEPEAVVPRASNRPPAGSAPAPAPAAAPGANPPPPGASRGAARPGGPPPAMKSTMVGLGIPGGAPPPAPRMASSAPPRPGPGPGMFPKMHDDGPPVAKSEQTVMKQAAELLEEALREAGGSMDDVGTNPLFAGPSDAAPAPAAGRPSQAAGPAPETQAAAVAATPAPAVPTTDAEAARALVAAMAPGPERPVRAEVPARTSSPAPDSARPSRRPEARISRPSERSVQASEVTSSGMRGARSSQKKGSGALWLVLGGIAALAAVGVTYRDRLMVVLGAGAPPAAISAATQTASAAAPVLPAPSASAAPAESASAAAGDSADAALAATAATTDAAVGDASSDGGAAFASTDGGIKAASATPVAPATVPVRPRPVNRPVPTAAPPAATDTTSDEPAATATAAAPTAKPTATAAATATAPAATATATAKPKSDDNPY